MKNSTSSPQERPPIVVVLGHVDHGKSTLLDYIRKTNIVEHEAGGITQRVAAYEVEHRVSGRGKSEPGSPKKITFIDTPGHAAFRTIRSRGAKIADIAVLVVAADDGVKPQTLEALESIRTAKIPFIVALNKIDKPNANVERAQAGLMENAVYLEKLGGDVPWAAISARTGAGVPELLDLIALVAEVESLTGNSSVPAEGFCLEAHRDQKRGIAATLIITNGTLLNGQAVLAGHAIAPVRIMENYAGKSIRQATFSSPVSLTGFDELPEAGESFRAYGSKRDAEEARSASSTSRDGSAALSSFTGKPVAAQLSAEEVEREAEQFMMPIIVRADMTGSLEAIQYEANRIGDAHSRIAIVQSGVGNISEGDIKAAIATVPTPAAVLGFNVDVERVALERARQHNIHIERFDIIYKLVERLEELLHDSAPRRLIEETVGSARIAKCFSKRKNLQVVGGTVTEGHFQKGGGVKVFRRSVVIGTGKIKNLQAHKKDVERVESGSEFGAQIEAVFEISQGDIVECFVTVQK